jgi:mannan endo-1,4-beta-mannosidase
MVQIIILNFSRLISSLLLINMLFIQSCDSDEDPIASEGSTFKVVGTKLTDPCGETVILKGVNKMSVFDENDLYGENYFPEIARFSDKKLHKK